VTANLEPSCGAQSPALDMTAMVAGSPVNFYVVQGVPGDEPAGQMPWQYYVPDDWGDATPHTVQPERPSQQSYKEASKDDLCGDGYEYAPIEFARIGQSLVKLIDQLQKQLSHDRQRLRAIHRAHQVGNHLMVGTPKHQYNDQAGTSPLAGCSKQEYINGQTMCAIPQEFSGMFCSASEAEWLPEQLHILTTDDLFKMQGSSPWISLDDMHPPHHPVGGYKHRERPLASPSRSKTRHQGRRRALFRDDHPSLGQDGFILGYNLYDQEQETDADWEQSPTNGKIQSCITPKVPENTGQAGKDSPEGVPSGCFVEEHLRPCAEEDKSANIKYQADVEVSVEQVEEPVPANPDYDDLGEENGHANPDEGYDDEFEEPEDPEEGIDDVMPQVVEEGSDEVATDEDSANSAETAESHACSSPRRKVTNSSDYPWRRNSNASKRATSMPATPRTPPVNDSSSDSSGRKRTSWADVQDDEPDWPERGNKGEVGRRPSKEASEDAERRDEAAEELEEPVRQASDCNVSETVREPSESAEKASDSNASETVPELSEAAQEASDSKASKVVAEPPKTTEKASDSSACEAQPSKPAQKASGSNASEAAAEPSKPARRASGSNASEAAAEPSKPARKVSDSNASETVPEPLDAEKASTVSFAETAETVCTEDKVDKTEKPADEDGWYTTPQRRKAPSPTGATSSSSRDKWVCPYSEEEIKRLLGGVWIGTRGEHYEIDFKAWVCNKQNRDYFHAYKLKLKQDLGAIFWQSSTFVLHLKELARNPNNVVWRGANDGLVKWVWSKQHKSGRQYDQLGRTRTR